MECTGTNQVRLCSKPGDCTETNFTGCCTFTEGSLTLSFCFDPDVAPEINGTCMVVDAGTDGGHDAGHD